MGSSKNNGRRFSPKEMTVLGRPYVKPPMAYFLG